MLTEYGNTRVWPEWYVNETTPPTFTRVYYVYGGRVTCFCGENISDLRPGFLYLFPTTLPYRLVQDPEHPLLCTFLHLDICPSLVSGVTEIEINTKPVLKTLLQSFSLSLKRENKQVIEAIADTIQTYFCEHGYFSGVSTEIAAAFRLIFRDKQRMPSVEELSAACGYHPQYFIKKFKKEIGMPPHQYLIHLRLREAAFLLAQGMSVSEAVVQSGFSDFKNFEKAFRRKYGMPPGKYRINRRPAP